MLLVFGVCNLISVVACCDYLYVRINFDVKKTATDHRIVESKYICNSGCGEGRRCSHVAGVASKALGMIN